MLLDRKISIKLMRAFLPAREAFSVLNHLLVKGLSDFDLMDIVIGILRKYKVLFINTQYGFPQQICVSVNNILTHGICKGYRLKNQDVVNIDIFYSHRGVIVDCCRSWRVMGNRMIENRELKDIQWSYICYGETCNWNLRRMNQHLAKILKPKGWSVCQQYAGHYVLPSLHEGSLPYVGGVGVIDKERLFTVEPIFVMAKRYRFWPINEHELCADKKCVMREDMWVIRPNGSPYCFTDEERSFT